MNDPSCQGILVKKLKLVTFFKLVKDRDEVEVTKWLANLKVYGSLQPSSRILEIWIAQQIARPMGALNILFMIHEGFL